MIVSTDYVEITEAEAREKPRADAWKDASIPAQQLALTDGELRRWKKGETIAPFDALTDALSSIPRQGSVLEIGCGVGHGAEVMAWMDYTGVDYSEDFILAARSRRPAFKFELMDALRLEYAEKQFDIAISSCCILHIVDWREALSEACRVAKCYVILHRTPVSNGPMRYFLKKAYGVWCVEIHFNRDEIMAEMALHEFNFRLEVPVTDEQSTMVFERAIFHQAV